MKRWLCFWRSHRPSFSGSFGRHEPWCGGRCLAARVDAENSTVRASVFLILAPTLVFVGLLPLSRWWMALSALSLALLALSIAYLLLAMFTEPGILPVAPPRATGTSKRRCTHVVVDGEECELRLFRAKMCRQTENCVEEFDHFCPWVGNSVGRRNYRYFFSFIVSTASLSLVVGGAACLRLTSSDVARSFVARTGRLEAASTRQLLAIACLLLIVAFTAVVLCSVSSLVCFHARLIATNQTTNENIRGAYLDRRNPHDLGCVRNCLVFSRRELPRSRIANSLKDRDDCSDDDDHGGANLEMV